MLARIMENNHSQTERYMAALTQDVSRFILVLRKRNDSMVTQQLIPGIDSANCLLMGPYCAGISLANKKVLKI
jgi:hypothetical protein